MGKDGILMRDKETKKTIQLFENLSFGEAFSKVWDLRSQYDGNWYWIGRIK